MVAASKEVAAWYRRATRMGFFEGQSRNPLTGPIAKNNLFGKFPEMKASMKSPMLGFVVMVMLLVGAPAHADAGRQQAETRTPTQTARLT